ncbi:putative copper amine oxidase, partial [Hortaea werneckii]
MSVAPNTSTGDPPFQSATTLRTRPHPLRLISDSEIFEARNILLETLRQGETPPSIRFKNITLHEPAKADLLPYLDAETLGTPAALRPFVPRCVEVIWSAANERIVHESIISLDANAEVSRTGPQKGQHGSIDRYEAKSAAEKIVNHPEVREAVKALGLAENVTIACDPWMYGADCDNDEETHKFIQGYLYALAPGKGPESNQYSYPLPFSPVYDVFTGELARIEPMGTGGREDGLQLNTADGLPMAHCVPNEYHADILDGPQRTDLKPLHVTQPEGPSFNVTDGNCVSWQKWRFRVGFNYREGMTIHDVRYDGRPLFYRLSISEMTVPYGDPRTPYHRKQAMDLGDAGAGSCANNLRLGCDCLGTIKYFSGWLNDENGMPVPAENVICMHEQDGGIGWKHTHRLTHHASVVRARNLVLQTIITVGNYEYIFAWIFMQNGNVDLEVRATGILSTSLIDEGKTSEWGNVVSPGTLAANHQHLFSMRVDPMIDGARNTVVQEDSAPIPQTEDMNPHGNAWRVVKTPFETSGYGDADPFANRCFKIVNENIFNPVSGNPVGYKLVPQPCQLLLAGKDSVVRKRAKFSEHHIWVTKY